MRRKEVGKSHQYVNFFVGIMSSVVRTTADALAGCYVVLDGGGYRCFVPSPQTKL
jgi:hypothetical protein